MRNPLTGKHEVRRRFKSYDFEVVGVGETKEEAKADLKKKLEEYRIPGTDYVGYQGRKYRPKMKPLKETIRSPGYQMQQDENGSVRYVFNENRQAQIFVVDKGEQNLAKNDKVDPEA